MSRLNIKKLSNDAELKSNMHTLVNLTILSKSSKKNKLHRILEHEYKDVVNDNWLTKVSLTISNAIITQDKSVFILTRESITRLLKSDTNHINPVSMKNDQYKIIIQHISKYLCSIKKYKNGYNRYIMVCSVIAPTILKQLKSNRLTQEQEVRMFINGEIQEEQFAANEATIEAIKSITQRYIDIKNNQNIIWNSSFRIPSKIKKIEERYNKVK